MPRIHRRGQPRTAPDRADQQLNRTGNDATNAQEASFKLRMVMERLKAIRASTRRAKEHLQSLPKSVIEGYTMAIMGPYMVQLITGLGGRTRPAART